MGTRCDSDLRIFGNFGSLSSHLRELTFIIRYLQNPMTYFSNRSNGKRASLLVAVLIAMTLVSAGCGESFLAPKPQSFLSPQIFTDKRGLEGVLANLNKALRTEYYGVHQMILTEYYFTDIAICAAGPPTWPHDLRTQLTPTGDAAAKTREYWSSAYDRLKYANLIIANIDDVTNWSSKGEKFAMLAAAYFHRAYWYYRLVHQFGDVPVYLTAITGPKLDFETYSREAILKQMRNDVEFAVKWLPVNVRPGDISRAAGYYLLTKIYLSLRQFQDAVDAASHVINSGRYALMTERFGNGPHADDPRFNVLWDLHQKENKSIPANTEAILVVQDDYGIEGNREGGTQITRFTTPAWWWRPVKDPNGFHATTDGPAGNPLSDSLGRGIGALATVPYFNYTIWKNAGGDLRHSEVNWFSKDDFYYNNPKSEYYGEPFVREYIGDTTRTWYPFMYNKLYVPDQLREHLKRGGHSDWYIYRLAGLYLLRAEAYYWMGQMGQAAADINVVRRRAKAPPISPSEVTIDYIFDERARELYMEAPRKTELTRVAYIMAQLGRRGYSLETMHLDNWYYDRIMKTNVYYREHIVYGTNPYVMKPYHVYWPIPQSEIDANIHGHINQTPGYTGWESNVEPLGYEAIQKLAAQAKYAGQ